MAITDIFYTDTCNLMEVQLSQPNMFGIVSKTHNVAHMDIPCCLTPISTSKAQMKYGINSEHSFEVSMDMFQGLDVHKVSAIQYRGTTYEVQSYEVYSEFLILPESVTFLVKKVN